jgi:hypothetical protein
MTFQKTFSSLLFTGLITISAIAAQAQIGDARFKKVSQSPTLRVQTDAVTISDESADTVSRNGDSDRPDKEELLLGTWDLVLTFSDGSSARSTLTVVPGASDREGSIIHSAEPSLAPPNPTLPEQGTWRHVKGRHFIASYRGWSFTETFQPFGTIGFRHAITVSPDGNTFTGRAVFEVKDSTGQVLFADEVQSQGTRQRAVGP